jgi:hypothetical protein
VALKLLTFKRKIWQMWHETTHLLLGQLVMFLEGPWPILEPYPRLWVYIFKMAYYLPHHQN